MHLIYIALILVVVIHPLFRFDIYQKMSFSCIDVPLSLGRDYIVILVVN